MDTIKLIKWSALIILASIIYFFPPPEGLTSATMHILAIYLAAIIGIIIRPAGESEVLVIVAGIGSVFVGPAPVLNGFATTTVWLVFIAFLIGMAFIQTGIGKRVSYILIGRFGKSSMALGYIMALVDLLISPATPSNTARSGGVIYPIFQSISTTLGSEPNSGRKKIGAYFTMLQGLISFTTAGIFITACAPNLITVDFAKKVMGVDITWGNWALAMIVPGVIILLLTPLFLYKIYRPEIKGIDNFKELARKGLDELGPMKLNEKVLLILFILAVLGWAFGSTLKLNSTAVALAFFALALLFNLFSIKDVLHNKGAWNTFLWYGIICGLSASLAKEKFFVWLAKWMQSSIPVESIDMIFILGIIIFVCIAMRYLFASMAAFVTAFVPVAFTIGVAGNISPYVLAYMVAACTAYGCSLTHYGGALGPILYGTGYVTQKEWWQIGFAYTLLNVLVYFTIGLSYWKFIGLW